MSDRLRGSAAVLRSHVQCWLALTLSLILAGCTGSNTEVLRNVQGTPIPPVPTLDARQVVEGRRLYDTLCATCHGPNGVGSTPNWKVPDAEGNFPPPPHNDDGHTWHHPDRVLVEIIRDGFRDTLHPNAPLRMPAFGNQLSDIQTRAITSYFKSLWSKEHREYQWEIDLQDRAYQRTPAP